MKYFFEDTFYDPELNNDIPEGAVELTDEAWQELLEQQAAGKVISAGEDGSPVAADPPPPSAEEQARITAEALYDTLRVQTEMKSVQLSIPLEDDATALTLSPVCPDWEMNHHYEAGEIVNHNGQAYRVIQAVNSLENQPPGAEGMLAIYRPLNPGHAGTLEDPIPFVNGMDVYNGKYYSFNEKTYLAKADMLPCIWDPGTAGLWQWEEVMDEPEGFASGQ